MLTRSRRRPVAAPYAGPTYYDRAQLKPAPFEPVAVGFYTFLAGVSGGAAILATLTDLLGGPDTAPLVRRGRFLSLLAPTIGSALLVWDLHTPQRFYNMFRIAKATSPMSIGTWILTAFSATAGITAAGDVVGGRLGRLARLTQIPTAIAGMGLATYTASLLSATSTPLWNAAPRAMAVRFAGSSIAAATAAMALFERSRTRRRDLDDLMLAALVAELGGGIAATRTYRATGVAEAMDGGWGAADRLGAGALGAWLPAAALLVAGARGWPAPRLVPAAVLAGSAILRIASIGMGGVSAARPDISLRATEAPRRA